MQKKICYKCNNECNNDDKYCSNCGEKLEFKIDIQDESPKIEPSIVDEEKQITEFQNYNNINEMSDIYNWFAGMIIAAIAFSVIISATLSSMFLFAVAAVLIPPIKTKIENIFNFKISGKIKTLFVSLSILFCFVFGVIQQNNYNYKINLQLAEKSFKNKNYVEAIKYYNTAKSYKPDSLDVKKGLVKASKLNKIKIDKEVKILISNGNKYYLQKNWGETISEYNKAITLDNDIKKSLSGKLEKAEKEFTKQQKIKELTLAKKQKAEEKAKEIKQMKVFEGSTVQIAVARVKITRTTEESYSNGNNRFVWLGISAYNATGGTVHVNPNDFTLSDSSGYTVSHDTDTYSLSNYFDAVNLPPSGETSGWLIFYLPKDSHYTLHYNGFDGSADKKVVVH